MEIKKHITSAYTTLEIIGEVDALSAIELDDSIKSLLGEGAENLLIDCRGLAYISSAGLGVFMSYIKTAEANNQKMILFGLIETVSSTFEILGLHHIIKIVNTKEEAVSQC